MSASSTASSTLTRSKAAILVITGLAAAYLIYYNQSRFHDELLETTIGGPGLHRSNAISRRRRRTRTLDGPDDHRDHEPSSDQEEQNESIVGPLGDGETVIDDGSYEEWDWSQQNPTQRNGQNIVQLLFRVSEEATRRNAYVHRGCQCNSCGMVPIRGIRYRCSNCADFDLCEACEAQGVHIKTHVFYKVRVPTSSFATRQMQPVWYPGDPDTQLKSLPRDFITRLSKETGFDRSELDAYWEQWTFMANTEWRDDPDGLGIAMDRKTFDQCLVPSGGNRHAAPNLIHDRMFAFYDTNHDELISFPEFLNGLAYRKKKGKLKKVFEGFDINGDGFVDRKDFLRMFRSYYVLFKQMHRDMLEGLDDQVMNSTEAHQLVSGRQPLSSVFGREGSFPAAPDLRTGEGKAQGADGDLEVTDDKGVISANGNDTGNKEDVIIDAVVRDYPRWQQQAPWAPTDSNTYWRAVMNPPETIAGLQHDVLEVLIRERRRAAEDNRRPMPRNNHEQDEINEYVEDDVVYRDWPPSFVTIDDVEAVCGKGCAIGEVPPLRIPEVVEYALRRLRELSVSRQTLAVNQEIHERWKRRQFYTDEEEGVVAPPDWKEEEDVLHQNGKATETAKDVNPPSRPLSPRSRSSSKVRFAEHIDDFETRSNASTSSRSIPERWGGMEIPEAEKDAGKEILYQVTQQACNELLDQLFKKQESLAVSVLSSKKARDKYRHLFTDPGFERWATEVDKEMHDIKKDQIGNPSEAVDEVRRNTAAEDSFDSLRSRPLDQLLAEMGFTLDEQEKEEVTQDEALVINNENEAGMIQPGRSTADEDPKPTSFATAEISASDDAEGDPSHGEAANEEHQQALSQPPESYRDPTLPQFRPNTISPPQSAPSTSVGLDQSAPHSEATSAPPFGSVADFDDDGTVQEVQKNGDHQPSVESPTPNSPTEQWSQDRTYSKEYRQTPAPPIPHLATIKNEAISSSAPDLRKQFLEVDWTLLYDLRKKEMQEKEADARGGWGRLSYEEFEEAIKGEDVSAVSENSRKAMMDYLGSWIDFCIP
jgi:Ca2+-binding EF-hand superfamily protein